MCVGASLSLPASSGCTEWVCTYIRRTLVSFIYHWSFSPLFPQCPKCHVRGIVLVSSFLLSEFSSCFSPFLFLDEWVLFFNCPFSCVYFTLFFDFAPGKRLLRLKRRANIKSGERVSQLCFTLYIVHCYLISRLLSLSVLCVISITSSCVCDLLLTLTRRGRCLYLLFRAEDKRETLPDNFAPSLHPLFTCVIPLSGPMFAYLCTVTGEHRHRHRHWLTLK